MSEISDIADEVTQTIHTATLSMMVVPERKYMPTSVLPDLKTVTVSVMPASMTVGASDRGNDLWTWTILVGVQKVVRGASDSGEIDALVSLVVEIADLFKNGSVTVPGSGEVPLTTVVIDPVFSREDMTENSLFTSVIALSFVGLR